MLRTIFAIGVVGFLFVAASGSTYATPIAPIAPSYTLDFSILSDVSWRRCWRDRWGRLHCRRCWRDGWGRVRCW